MKKSIDLLYLQGNRKVENALSQLSQHAKTLRSLACARQRQHLDTVFNPRVRWRPTAAPDGVATRRTTMRRRDTAGLQRLVTERREGILGRRDFLTTLAAGAAVVAAPHPAGGQKKIAVTMWDTQPKPA